MFSFHFSVKLAVDTIKIGKLKKMGKSDIENENHSYNVNMIFKEFFFPLELTVDSLKKKKGKLKKVKKKVKCKERESQLECSYDFLFFHLFLPSHLAVEPLKKKLKKMKKRK